MTMTGLRFSACASNSLLYTDAMIQSHLRQTRDLPELVHTLLFNLSQACSEAIFLVMCDPSMNEL
jgi:hypothetical protein